MRKGRAGKMAEYLLDSNVLILAIRGKAKALDFLDELESQRQPIYISVITRTEVLAGMREHEEKRTRELLALLMSLPVNVKVSDRAGQLINQYRKKGVQLPFRDTLIGATALEYGLTLATANRKDFPYPDLKLREILYP